MGDEELDIYWAEISQVFKLGPGFEACPPLGKSRALHLSHETVHYLKTNLDMAYFVEDFILDVYNIRLREEVVPSFWRHFEEKPTEEEAVSTRLKSGRRLDDESEADGGSGGRLASEDASGGFQKFESAVTHLHISLGAFMPGLQDLARLRLACGISQRSIFGQSDVNDLFKLYLKGTLHSQLPANFLSVVKAFYSQAFMVFYTRAEKDMDDSSEDLTCEGCNQSTDSCHCPAISSAFQQVNMKLAEMDLLDRLSSQAVTEIVHERIYSHVQETCKGSFEESYLCSLERWLDNVVMAWVKTIFFRQQQQMQLQHQLQGRPTFQLPEPSPEVTEYRATLMQYLYETYTKARIEQLFNIIIEFPDSQPALEDLRDCLGHTNLRNHLTTSLKQVLDVKLLHPGVNTADILTAYIAAIRSLRVLDGSGVVLELVCENVRKYLKTREDTVKCIVQSLIDESATELAEELLRTEGLQLDENWEDEEVQDGWEDWQPDPVDADPNKTSRSRRLADIISMLVNIYGSKDLFVNEYRSLLSNRILSHCSYETEREIRYLEMLKLRFGEVSLHHCEVMLKDVGDSKRINYQLHSQDGGCPELITQAFRVNALILSAQFWPQFKTETVELPAEITEALEVYNKAFQTLKGNRTLVWKPSLGTVNLELEIGDKKVELNVSPTHAAIIYKFQESEEWTAASLAAALKLPLSTLRRRMVYWQSQGLVRESSPDTYHLIADGHFRRSSGVNTESQASQSGGGGGGGGHHEEEGEDEESPTASSRDQREAELSIFWSYIVGMLTNLDSMPIERIHQMLRIFAMQGPSAVECDIGELRAFLDNKVRQQMLAFSGGEYRLPK